MKKAFTLAEVLITLVIIGVISAITIPLLSANYKREELKTSYKKTYSDLSNFARRFQYDYGISFSEYTYEHKGAAKDNLDVLLSYFNRAGTITNNTWNTPEEDKDEGYPIKNLLGTDIAPQLCDNTGFHADLSGRMYRLNDAPAEITDNGPIICIDTNGPRGPNKTGYDYFAFIFTTDSRVIPMGAQDPNNKEAGDEWTATNFVYYGPTHCNKKGYSSGFSCSYYAFNDKHPTNPKKTYWKDFI